MHRTQLVVERSGSDILSPDSCLLASATQKMKVTPGMLMKTKGDGKQVTEESVLRAAIGGFKIHDFKTRRENAI